MDSTYCLRILLALFPACVTCLGNYGGSMPTADVRRVSAHAFPVIGPEVKQMGSLNNPSYNSVYQPHQQGTYGRHDGFKERLFMGSNSKDCQTKRDNHENMINFRPSKYDFSDGQPSAQYEARTATSTFTNVQPSSRLASTLSQMSSLKIPESSYVAKMTGSVVQPSKTAYSHVDISAGVRDPLARGPNYGSTSISSKMSHQYSLYQGSQSTNKLQTASSSYGPVLKGTSISRMNLKPYSSGLAYTEPKPSIVSSGPILVVGGGESTQGHGVYSGIAGSPKPSDVGHYQVSHFSRDTTMTASSQVKSWNEPLQNIVSGAQYSPILERRKASESQCRNNVAKFPAGSETLLEAPESAQRNALSPSENTRFKFQQTYNTHGLPNQAFKPNYPSKSGVQKHVPKPSIVSSGAILIMQAPTNVQSGTESGKGGVPPSFPERKVPFTSGPTAHQYQPFQVAQNSRNVRPGTNTYVSSSYKPSSRPLNPSSGFTANNPNIAGSNEINTVRVRLNKLPTSSFGKLQNQWASGGISSAAHLSQRPGQNVQTPVTFSVPQYRVSKGVQSRYVVTQGNADSSRQITVIPNEFGQGAIRRLSSNYRQGLLQSAPPS